MRAEGKMLASRALRTRGRLDPSLVTSQGVNPTSGLKDFALPIWNSTLCGHESG